MKNLSRSLSISLSALILLSGCSGGNESVYIDTSDTESGDNYFGGDISENFSYNTCNKNIMNDKFTFDGSLLYVSGPPEMTVDINSGQVRVFCDVPGCAHKENSPDCLGYNNFWYATAAPDGIYYTDSDKLCLYDGEQKVIFTNDFFTDYEEENHPDAKNDLSKLLLIDNTLYVFGTTFCYTYDIQTKQLSEPFKVTGGVSLAVASDGKKIYTATDSGEMYMYDFDTNEYKKTGDNIWTVQYKNGYVYYVQYENEIPMLYRADTELKESVKLIEDCYVNFLVTESHIYYQNFSDEALGAYVCDLDGKNAKPIQFPKEDPNVVGKAIVPGLLYITPAGNTDKVCMKGGAYEEYIFVIEDGSDEVSKLISLYDYQDPINRW